MVRLWYSHIPTVLGHVQPVVLVKLLPAFGAKLFLLDSKGLREDLSVEVHVGILFVKDLRGVL